MSHCRRSPRYSANSSEPCLVSSRKDLSTLSEQDLAIAAIHGYHLRGTSKAYLEVWHIREGRDSQYVSPSSVTS